MADNRAYVISKTLNGDNIYYIARNKGGNVFARELSMEKLEKAIKTYKEPSPVFINTKGEEEQLEKPKEKKYLINSLLGKVQDARKKRASKKTPPTEEPIPAEPKQVENEMQAQVAKRRKGSKKSSFWDKLK
ncbi:MAG: hypothetical protein Q8P29_01210 [Candidatus Levybacteria bacterium]|nr:hypothetical protein [Candidatus Levybacteria bacterium]